MRRASAGNFDCVREPFFARTIVNDRTDSILRQLFRNCAVAFDGPLLCSPAGSWIQDRKFVVGDQAGDFLLGIGISGNSTSIFTGMLTLQLKLVEFGGRSITARAKSSACSTTCVPLASTCRV